MSFVERINCIPRFYDKVRVKSKIILGEYFLEYQYNSFTEDFIGTWRKIGVEHVNNPSTTSLQCSGCVNQSETWPKRRGIQKPVSYQCVGGRTKNFNRYDWNVGKCSNPVCWGPSEYLFEVKMMNNLNFQFSHKKLMNLNLPGEEIIGRYNCTLTRKYNLSHKDNHFTEGITMTSRKLKMFYPHIIDSEDPGANYYIYISMYPKVNLPEHSMHLYDVNFASWPSQYQNSDYQYPNHLVFEYFLETPGLSKPDSIFSLEKDHKCVGATHLDLYPGGGGMKCTQYKHLSNLKFSLEESFRQEEELRRYHDEKKIHVLYDDEPDFSQAKWINNHHVYKHNTFVPNIRDGLAGPIISYWARLDSKRRWFASPILKQDKNL